MDNMKYFMMIIVIKTKFTKKITKKQIKLFIEKYSKYFKKLYHTILLLIIFLYKYAMSWFFLYIIHYSILLTRIRFIFHTIWTAAYNSNISIKKLYSFLRSAAREYIYSGSVSLSCLWRVICQILTCGKTSSLVRMAACALGQESPEMTAADLETVENR